MVWAQIIVLVWACVISPLIVIKRACEDKKDSVAVNVVSAFLVIWIVPAILYFAGAFNKIF